MTTMTEQVASYIYDHNISFGTYNIFACYDSLEDYDERKVSFYDIYEKDGFCVNEGDPHYTFPSWQEIYELYWLPSVREASQTFSRDLKKATNERY
jgi:hypothetical protein